VAPDGFGGGGDRLRIAEVAAAAGLQLAVELVEQRHAGRNVELDDFARGHPVEHLDHGAQAVAVRHDQHIAAGAQLGRDARVPEGQHARQRVLQRLGGG
jgi:hypothetical protein